MPGLQIIITKAGRAALVNAEHNGTAPLKITEIGITAAVFTANDDTTALPGEIKRIKTISGEVVAPDTLHVTIRDDGADTYTMRGIGYWLSNGVLLGVYSQPDPILQKSTQSMMLLAADVVFANIKATTLAFGDANFTNPPATADCQGVIELATVEETKAGKDVARAVTPAGLAPAMDQAIANHRADADPHRQYLTSDRANALYFHRLPAYASSDTDCDTLLETGVRDVSVANDRGILAATHLPVGGDGYGTLTTLNSGNFIRQVYTEGGTVQRTWERTGFLGATPPFASRNWKLVWDSVTFDPASKQNTLGFTPVQQGTGIGQKSNIVKIGWSGENLKVTLDDSDLGALAFQSNLDAALKNYLPLTGGRLSGKLTVTGSAGNIAAIDSEAPALEVSSDDAANSDAFMTFRRAGRFAAHFGLDANNDFAVGGYSMGKVSYKFWHAGNFDPGTKVTGAGFFLKWAGKDGQPTWLLGGNAADDINVYNPSNFRVAYASSAGTSQNAEYVGNGAGYMRMNWSDPGGQTVYVWGSDGPTGARLSATTNLSVGNARTWNGFPLRFAENPGVQPYYLLGIEGGRSDFSLYHRASMAVGSSVNAQYANQLSGQGLQHGGIGGYVLNKNKSGSGLAGAWEQRGQAYDYGSGAAEGNESSVVLWQRVA